MLQRVNIEKIFFIFVLHQLIKIIKARGKSGPLFIFDAHDDIRIQNDASIEKEESHAGKVLLRSKKCFAQNINFQIGIFYRLINLSLINVDMKAF